jgi:anaerobic selenocysteine-containing dehydrogenase
VTALAIDDGPVTGGEAICPRCGVGCRLAMESADGRLVRVRGVADSPASLGGICARGATLPQWAQSPDRLTRPLLRTRRGDDPRPTTWSGALQWTASRIREIIAAHGPDAVAFLGGGRLDSEAAYVAAKLFKGFLGTNNTGIDGPPGLDDAGAGYRASLGADGSPACLDDIERSDCLVAWGGDLAESHPITFDRLRGRRRAEPGVELIVVAPRPSPAVELATLHVPAAPGRAIALMNAVGRRLIEEDRVDQRFLDDHTRSFGAYRDSLLDATWDDLVAASGVPERLILDLAARIARARAWLSLGPASWGRGVPGAWADGSLINLHLLTGQIGRPGAGPLALAAQPNARGVAEGGLPADRLPGDRPVDDARHRAEVEAHWGRPPGTIAARPGLAAAEVFPALESGRLKAIWIAAADPAAGRRDVRRALARAELVVVQEVRHPTETTRLADVLLPSARWSEKVGTSTGGDRLVSRSEQVVAPPGAALPDWEILARFGRALGCDGFAFRNPAEVWDEFIASTAGRPCDMAGMTADRLRRVRHLRWPCPTTDHPGTPRLYADGLFPTADGRARFLTRPHRDPVPTPTPGRDRSLGPAIIATTSPLPSP